MKKVVSSNRSLKSPTVDTRPAQAKADVLSLALQKSNMQSDPQAAAAEFDATSGVNHIWMLGVCDDLIDYTELHGLSRSSTQLRHLIIALVKDIEQTTRATKQ